MESSACKSDYQGPLQAIVGNNDDCINPINNPLPANTGILVYPMDKCQQEDVYLKRVQPFSVTSCEPAIGELATGCRKHRVRFSHESRHKG